MIYKFFGIFTMVTYLIAPSLGCEYARLEAEAETLSNRIFCKEELTTPMISTNLSKFLYDEKKVELTYRNRDEFTRLLALKKTEIPDSTFLTFANLCEQAYDLPESTDRNRTALHMLFEITSQKFQRLYKLRERKLPEKSHPSPATMQKMLEAADKFFSMDKSGATGFGGTTPPIGSH